VVWNRRAGMMLLCKSTPHTTPITRKLGVEQQVGEKHVLTSIHRLKLKLYRTLGIDVEADPTTGEYNKAVIRNAQKGDVHVVNIDPKFSRHFYTNYFWRTL
jgi:kinetochore protein Spc24